MLRTNIPVGEVRPSQLLWTYGPGALIDLPNLSVITMGLDRWDENRCLPIDEGRLLDAVRRIDQVGNHIFLGPMLEGAYPTRLIAEKRGITDCRVNIYSDSDVDADFYKKIRPSIRPYSVGTLAVYYNELEKDSGVSADRIRLRRVTI